MFDHMVEAAGHIDLVNHRVIPIIDAELENLWGCHGQHRLHQGQQLLADQVVRELVRGVAPAEALEHHAHGHAR